MEKLAADVLAGSQRALARAISVVENNDEGAAELLASLFPRTGRAETIGITGPPGSGKSTLVDKMIALYRRAGKRVGVLAVDPTSPFTGGAILGDRVRMSTQVQGDGVFVRSMASRGHLGGLSRSCPEAMQILDAAGFDIVLVETVGIGQDEVEVARFADTTVVVLVPGLGDDVQIIKAGIMEIGDIFALNKSDRPDAGKVELDFMNAIEFLERPDGWRPPLIKTVALKIETVGELIDAIATYSTFAREHGILEKKRRDLVMHSLRQMLSEEIQERAFQKMGQQRLAAVVDCVLRREAHPRMLAADLARELMG